MSLEPGRVVVVWNEGRKKAGSGYAVSESIILTASHVVEGDGVLEVRRAGEAEWVGARRLWREEGGEGSALLRLDMPISADLAGPPRWAACCRVELQCEAVGFPGFREYNRVVDTEHFRGALSPLSGLESGMLYATSSVDRPPAGWRGMSGAALFSDGHIVGVVQRSETGGLVASPTEPAYKTLAGGSLGVQGLQRLSLEALWGAGDSEAVKLLDVAPHPFHGGALPPSRLLAGVHGVVPFDESLRAEAFQELQAFSDGADPAVLVVLGEGGVGKTRLLEEWCSRLRGQGWLAGFLDRTANDVGSALAGRTRRFLVLDYADGATQTSAQIMRAMLRRDAPTTRLVLVARKEGRWLDLLGEDERFAGLINHRRPLSLSPVQRVDYRRSFDRARSAFVGSLSKTMPHLSSVEERGGERYDADISAQEELPLLVVHMIALLRCLGDLGQYSESSEVLHRVLLHEKRVWKSILRDALGRECTAAEARDVARMAAAIVAFDGVDRSGGVWSVAQLLEVDERTSLSAVFNELYCEGEVVRPLAPDLLAEQLLLEVVQDEEALRGSAGRDLWLDLPFRDASPPESPERLLILLDRLVRRGESSPRTWANALLETRVAGYISLCRQSAPGELPATAAVLPGVVEQVGSVTIAKTIRSLLPHESVSLREVALVAVKITAEHLRTESQDPETRADLVTDLAELGSRAGELGKYEDALRYTTEAVELGRALAAEFPESWEFSARLANALGSHAVRLAAVDRRRDAVAAGEEAVMRYGRAYEAGFNCLAGLAHAMDNLGLWYGMVDEWKEALRFGEEALRARRDYLKLVSGPERLLVLGDVARSLHNCANAKSNIGDEQGSLELAEESVSLRRELASSDADSYNPSLAVSLVNLSIDYREAGKTEEAEAASREAIEIYRALYSVRPGLFRWQLAVALKNLVPPLASRGVEESFSIASEAVELLEEELEARDVAAVQNDLAGALMHLGSSLHTVGRREDALSASRRAREIFMKLGASGFGDRKASIGAITDNISSDLLAFGAHVEALEESKEAVRIFRELEQSRPGAFADQLAFALTNLAVAHRGCEEQLQAAQVLGDVVHLRRRLAVRDPERYEPELARVLSLSALFRAERGKTQKAIDVAVEALRLALSRPPDPELDPRRAQAVGQVVHLLQRLKRSPGARVPTDVVRLLEFVDMRHPDAMAMWESGELLASLLPGKPT